MSTLNPADVREQIREGYAKIAREATVRGPSNAAQSSCCGGGGCCGPVTMPPESLAQALGYAPGDLAMLPEGANMGLSCGNPGAIAALRPGEIVLDLGSGGGLDCFLAGPKVGPAGRVIGVDMTPDMLAKARRGVTEYDSRTGLRNVEFRLGEIENLPVADASVDVVISNCVLNLSPDKPRVWREIARVLRPGGRVSVSDLALLRPLPEIVTRLVEALVGCVAGAALIEDIRAMIRAADLTVDSIKSTPAYIDAMMRSEDPLYQKILAAIPQGSKVSDYVTNVDITASKDVRRMRCC